MPGRRCTRIRGLLASAVLVALAGPASAGDGEIDSDEIWLPSLAASFELFDEEATGEVGPPPGGRFRDAGAERDTVTGIRLGTDLMAPELSGKLEDFRLLVGAGVQLDLDQEVPAQQAGDVLRRDQPDTDVEKANGAVNPAPVASFKGQGSEVSASHELPAWWLQLGVAYTIPWFTDARVRLKPSIEYFGEEIRVKGRHVVATDRSPLLPRFAVERRRGAETQVFHNLGPAFELEVVLKDSGWLTLSAFAQLRYLWAVGDRELTFRDDADQTVQFKYRRPANSFRGGAGVRLGWRGPLLGR